MSNRSLTLFAFQYMHVLVSRTQLTNNYLLVEELVEELVLLAQIFIRSKALIRLCLRLYFLRVHNLFSDFITFLLFSSQVKDSSRSRSYSPRGTERFPSISHDEDQRKMSGRFIRGKRDLIDSYIG